MPEITYEVVGNFVRETTPDQVTFHPILDLQRPYTFHARDIDGISIGGFLVRGRSINQNETIIVKPSYEEFKANVMKVLGVSAAGGRRRKTRRRHK